MFIFINEWEKIGNINVYNSKRIKIVFFFKERKKNRKKDIYNKNNE